MRIQRIVQNKTASCGQWWKEVSGWIRVCVCCVSVFLGSGLEGIWLVSEWQLFSLTLSYLASISARSWSNFTAAFCSESDAGKRKRERPISCTFHYPLCESSLINLAYRNLYKRYLCTLKRTHTHTHTRTFSLFFQLQHSNKWLFKSVWASEWLSRANCVIHIQSKQLWSAFIGRFRGQYKLYGQHVYIMHRKYCRRVPQFVKTMERPDRKSFQFARAVK